MSSETDTNVQTREREPWVRVAAKEAIQHFVWSIGDANPMWVDRDYAATSRWGDIIAPPCFLYAVDETTVAPGLDGHDRVYAEVEWTWFDVIRGDDELVAELRLVGEETTSWDGEDNVAVQLGEVSYSRADGTRVAVARTRCLRPRSSDTGMTELGDRPEHWYRSEELEAIEEDVLSEVARGTQDRLWEDVEVGDPVDSVVKGPLSIMDVVAWHAGTQGVPEEETGYSGGGLLEGCATGPQLVSWAGNAVTNWVGDSGFVHQMSIQMDSLVSTGDTTWWEGEAAQKMIVMGRPMVRLALRSRNQLGESIARGSVLVALPSKEHGEVQLPMKDVR